MARYRIADHGGTYFIQERRWLLFWKTDRSNHFRDLLTATRWVFGHSDQKRVVIFGADLFDIVS